MNDGQPKILLVDDDSFVCEMIAMILESRGYHVETTTQPRQALAKLTSASRYDVLITDMFMPDMTGLDLMRAVRDAGIDIAAVLLTGTGTKEIDEGVEQLQIQGRVPKDENVEAGLVDVVSKLLEKRQSAN